MNAIFFLHISFSYDFLSARFLKPSNYDESNFETTYFSNHRNANRAGAESKAKKEELISAPEAKSVLAINQIDFNFGIG